MRLTLKERQAIVSAFDELLNKNNGELYLFGSRVFDHKKGGDIDLLLIVPLEGIEEIKDSIVSIVDKIHGDIDEQKIDVTVASLEQVNSDLFLQAIMDEAVALTIRS